MSKREEKKEEEACSVPFFACINRSMYGRQSHRPYEINKLFIDRIDNNVVNPVHQLAKAFTLILTT
jgi:hypothetical protein